MSNLSPRGYEFDGACHCGDVAVHLVTPGYNEDTLPLRECQCRFCRTHGARTTSDPQGRLTITARQGALHRYRFGLKTAEFLSCARCASYVGATIGEGADMRATLNANLLHYPHVERREAEKTHYTGETAEMRMARRRAMWTPCVVSLQD
jgi:hypothetical protein